MFDEEIKKQTKEKKIYYVQLNNCRKVWEEDFSTKIWFQLCWGWTSIIDLCLPIAYFLGFSPVYLIGCDTDYKLDKENNLAKSYFYSSSDLSPEDLKMVQKEAIRGDFKHHQEVIRSFRLVKRRFEENNRTIFNAGKGGKLKEFNRVDFDELFQ